MAISIISLVFSMIALGCAGLSIYKIKKLYNLFKKEDITIERGEEILINNKKF